MTGKKLSVFAEAALINQTYSPAKHEGERYYRDFPELSETYSYELVDKKSYTDDKHELNTFFPSSSIGINAGVKFSFGKKRWALCPLACEKIKSTAISLIKCLIKLFLICSLHDGF